MELAYECCIDKDFSQAFRSGVLEKIQEMSGEHAGEEGDPEKSLNPRSMRRDRHLFKTPRWRPARLKEFLSLCNACRSCNLYAARKGFTTAHIRRMVVVNQTNKALQAAKRY